MISSFLLAPLRLIIISAGDNDIVDLENHSGQLGGQQQLLSLSNQRIHHKVLSHVVVASVEAVNAQSGVALLDLARLDRSQTLNRRKARVVSQSCRDGLQRVGKGSEGVLIDSGHVVGLLGNGNGTCNFGSSSSVNNSVVSHQVSNHTDGVVQSSLGLIYNHLVRASHKDSHGSGVGTLLDNQHSVSGGSELELSHSSSVAELSGRQILESGHDSGAGGNGQQLNLRSSNPSNGSNTVLKQQMVSLVVKSPLADDQIGTSSLDLGHHVLKGLLLVCLQLSELVDGANIELVLGLGLGGLEGARQNGNLDVGDVSGHLGVRHVLVQNHSSHKLGVFEGSSDLAIDLNELKVHVLSVEVGHSQNSVHGNVCEEIVGLGHNLGAQGGLGGLDESRLVNVRYRHGVGNLLESLHGNLGGLVETVGNSNGVDTLLDKLVGLVKQSSGQNHNTGGSVSDLVILRPTELDQKSCNLVLNLHLAHDGGSVVGDGNVSIRRNENLVQSSGTQGGLDDIRHGSSGQDVALDGLNSVCALLLSLAMLACPRLCLATFSFLLSCRLYSLSDNNERPSHFVLSHNGIGHVRHGHCLLLGHLVLCVVGYVMHCKVFSLDL